MSRSVCALVLALAALAPSLAAADIYFARNGLRVASTEEPGVMEVVSESGTGGSEFFRAAGEYARGPLYAGAGDRVAVVRPVSRSPRFNGRRTVLMALVPRGVPLPRDTGLLLDVGRVGENVSVAHAVALCLASER